MHNITAKTKKLATLAMMLAMVLTLSALEAMLPPLPLLPPGVRLGLSNIITMYALFFVGKRAAFSLCVLKSAFVAILRGVVAAALSLCGGVCALLILILLCAVFKDRISYLLLSVAGAIMHNIGQIAMAAVLLGSAAVLLYLPVLLISGVIMGMVTGALLRVVMPLFARIQ